MPELAYWWVSSLVSRFRFPAAVVGALAGFLAAAWLMSMIELDVWSGLALVVVGAAFSVFALRGVQATEIGTRIRMTWVVIALRAGLAVAVVLAVTEAAALIGPQWSGPARRFSR